MQKSLTEAVKEVVAKHRVGLRRERDSLTAAIAEADRERSELDSRSAEDPDNRALLSELETLISRLERDRWRREWLEDCLSLFDRIEEELCEASQQVEVDLVSSRLGETRDRLDRIKEEIPAAEAEVSRLREEVPVLEAAVLDLTERMASLRRGETGDSERQKK
jgi:septation ring formation regulator EzrA